MVEKRSTLVAVLTDLHFWVPVVVLVIGIVMLLMVGSR
jgi:hypothetical protein